MKTLGFTAILLLCSMRAAWASDCSSPGDCFNSMSAAIVAVTGLAIVALAIFLLPEILAAEGIVAIGAIVEEGAATLGEGTLLGEAVAGVEGAATLGESALLGETAVGAEGALELGAEAEGLGGEALTTEKAGSIRGVNAIGGNVNCLNCSIATDATLAGRPASALGGGPYRIDILEKTFGARFGLPGTIDDISKAMIAEGSGARGIVFGSRAGAVGHVFNVVNQNGVIRFLDGQIGKSASTIGYEFFRLLRTN